MSVIIPALLVHDKKTFIERLRAIEPYFSLAQIDVADGVFVPTTTWANPTDIQLIETPMHFELHLMVAHPLQTIQDWKESSNVKRVIFHIECEDDPEKIIEEILFYGWEAGIALNPETPTAAVEHFLDRVSVALFLGVHPGRSGAPFIPETVNKIKKFKQWSNETMKQSREVRIAVDGGVNHDTVLALKDAGAELFCMGSELFEKHASVKEAVEEIKKILQ